MIETQSTIHPIPPKTGYAPKPSGASPDRDANGRATPNSRKKNRRKERSKTPKGDPANDGPPDGAEPSGHVDIRAASFQVEMDESFDPAGFSAALGPERTEGPYIDLKIGTAIALQITHRDQSVLLNRKMASARIRLAASEGTSKADAEQVKEE